jgi:hypothetical protein
MSGGGDDDRHGELEDLGRHFGPGSQKVTGTLGAGCHHSEVEAGGETTGATGDDNGRSLVAGAGKGITKAFSHGMSDGIGLAIVDDDDRHAVTEFIADD